MIDPFSPAALGLNAANGSGVALASRPEPGIARSAVIGQPGLLSKDNPLVIFGGLLAVTLGLIGFATSARVGPIRAAFSAGKS